MLFQLTWKSQLLHSPRAELGFPRDPPLLCCPPPPFQYFLLPTTTTKRHADKLYTDMVKILPWNRNGKKQGTRQRLYVLYPCQKLMPLIITIHSTASTSEQRTLSYVAQLLAAWQGTYRHTVTDPQLNLPPH